MGEFDFTYKLPENFDRRVSQFLEQFGNTNVAKAFQRCKYEYEDIGLAFYVGIRGHWNKRALDFTFEGTKEDITLLQSSSDIFEGAIARALKPSESGFLVHNVFYFDSGASTKATIIPTSNTERLNSDIEAAENVLNDLVQIGERICLNPSFNSTSSENSINDSFRDILLMKGYDETKDQTRHGISSTGKDAAEVDILLTKEGKEIAIFEGLKLDSVNTSYIDVHIKKAVDNYNALGTATFIVAYVCSADFESFWNRYYLHIEKYVFPFQTRSPFRILAHPNAATRIATIILSRDGYDFPVYFIAFKIT